MRFCIVKFCLATFVAGAALSGHISHAMWDRTSESLPGAQLSESEIENIRSNHSFGVAVGADRPAESVRSDRLAARNCSSLARAAAVHDLPLAFFTRLIRQESNFNSKAVSRAGAQGIAQFMPATALWRGLSDPFEPTQALLEVRALAARAAGGVWKSWVSGRRLQRWPEAGKRLVRRPRQASKRNPGLRPRHNRPNSGRMDKHAGANSNHRSGERLWRDRQTISGYPRATRRYPRATGRSQPGVRYLGSSPRRRCFGKPGAYGIRRPATALPFRVGGARPDHCQTPDWRSQTVHLVLCSRGQNLLTKKQISFAPG